MGIFLSHSDINVFSSLGAWGVSGFLILSGFLMMLNYYNKNRIKTYTVKDNILFAISKIKKLYLLHIIMMIVAILLEIHNIVNNGQIIKLGIKSILNIFCVQAFVSNSGYYFSLNAVAWYLSVCLFIYFMFPWILRFFEKQMSKKKAAYGLIMCVILQIGFPYLASVINISLLGDGFAKWIAYICPITRLIDFIIGSLLGYLYIIKKEDKNEGVKNSNYSLIGVFLIIGVCILFTLTNSTDSDLYHPELWWHYTVIFTVPNSIFIWSIALENNILNKILTSSPLVFVGNLSADAFLIHQIVIRVIRKGLEVFVGVGNYLIFYIFLVVISLVLSLFVSIIWTKKDLIIHSVKKFTRGN